MGKAVGILGGSFDPVHKGHTGVARAAAEALGLDEVWMMPAAQAPLRDAAPRVSGEQRLTMVRLALEDAGDLRLQACDLEVSRGGTSYTAETLRELGRRHPDCAFTWIVGDDQWSRLASWREPEALAALADWAVYARPGCAKGAISPVPGMRWRRIEAADTWDISSSEIRARLAAGETPREALSDKVIEYIRKNGLYARPNL